MIALLLASLIACDENDSASAGTSRTWEDVYGTCANGMEQNIVPAKDLGSPIAYFVEVETPNGWVPYQSEDRVAPLLFRNEDTGLWFRCPDNVTSYHVSWTR